MLKDEGERMLALGKEARVKVAKAKTAMNVARDAAVKYKSDVKVQDAFEIAKTAYTMADLDAQISTTRADVWEKARLANVLTEKEKKEPSDALHREVMEATRAWEVADLKRKMAEIKRMGFTMKMRREDAKFAEDVQLTHEGMASVKLAMKAMERVEALATDIWNMEKENPVNYYDLNVVKAEIVQARQDAVEKMERMKEEEDASFPRKYHQKAARDQYRKPLANLTTGQVH
jgi:hypothetical protein